MARCLNGLGAASRLLGNYVQAEAEHQQSLSIYHEIGVKREFPFTLNNLGRVAFDQGDYQRAQERFQESLRLGQELETKPR
ncbi:MAG: tetratricopeptide repeat protein [Chloroflexi bacterium]|nr:tetratricopeptide repeat protein [Chloroflexota bacterium]